MLYEIRALTKGKKASTFCHLENIGIGITVNIYLSLLFTLMISLTNTVSAANYVSDKLFTYMHSGPSAQFRIMGSVNAGDEIKLIQNNAGSGYSKIVDPKGRSGWIETKFITQAIPAILRLPQVEKELSEVQNTLKSIDEVNKASLDNKEQSLSKQIATNNQLLAQRQQLIIKIQDLESTNAKLLNRIANQSEEVEMQWLIKGAAIISLGIFIGLVVPHLPRRKKKSNSW